MPMLQTSAPLAVTDVTKTFVMHLQGGIELPVVRGVNFELRAGECAVLGGPSGAGKSSILKMVYGNYAVNGGSILIRHEDRTVDLATADPRLVLAVRRDPTGDSSASRHRLTTVAD